MHFTFLSQKSIQLTYKLSLPLICNFSKQIYLLILIWEHSTIFIGPWVYEIPDCYSSMGTYAPLTTLHKKNNLRCKYHYRTDKSS